MVIESSYHLLLFVCLLYVPTCPIVSAPTKTSGAAPDRGDNPGGGKSRPRVPQGHMMCMRKKEAEADTECQAEDGMGTGSMRAGALKAMVRPKASTPCKPVVEVLRHWASQLKNVSFPLVLPCCSAGAVPIAPLIVPLIAPPGWPYCSANLPYFSAD